MMHGTIHIIFQYLDKKFSHFKESEVHCHFDEKPSQDPVLRRTNPIHTFPLYKFMTISFMGQKSVLIFTYEFIVIQYVTFSCQYFKINFVAVNMLCLSISESLAYKLRESISLSDLCGVYGQKKERSFTTPAFYCISYPKYKYELHSVTIYTYAGSQARVRAVCNFVVSTPGNLFPVNPSTGGHYLLQG